MLLVALPKGCINRCPEDSSLDTMHQVWSILQWSFEAIFYNKFPDFDHQGKPWPVGSARAGMAGEAISSDGIRAFIYAVQADGEYLSNEFGLNGASNEQVCFNCKGNKSDCPYNDFRPNALWKGTIALHKGTCPTDHLVGKIPGVVGEAFKYDVLHVLELGLTAHVLANCAFDWVCRDNVGWAGTQDQKLKTLVQKICQPYTEQGVDSAHWVRRFPLSAFCTPQKKWDAFPALSGIKAKQSRWMVPIFLAISEEFYDSEDSWLEHKHKCLVHLNAVYELLDEAPIHPSKAQAKSFKKHMDACLLHYCRLSNMAIEKGLLLWNVVPKFHLAAHLGDMFQWFNPKFYSCYAGETMVGLVAHLSHSTLNGSPGHLVPMKTCWRFRLGFHLRNLGNEIQVEASDSD
eukprot:Skav219306  [mRNA]  locus=scaffold2489:21209:22414:+ [translate_table: standard]